MPIEWGRFQWVLSPTCFGNESIPVVPDSVTGTRGYLRGSQEPASPGTLFGVRSGFG